MTSIAAVPRVEWPFTKVAHVDGFTRAFGHKTVKGDLTKWRGRFAGRTIEFTAQTRMLDAGAHFHTSSNARIRGDVGHGSQFLDVEITGGVLSPAEMTELAAITQRAVAAGGTDWPVLVRAKGAPVRSGFAAT